MIYYEWVYASFDARTAIISLLYEECAYTLRILLYIETVKALQSLVRESLQR